jgi:hypothetical protein
VVVARSLVELADAMEAAGPQLLHDSLMARPRYKALMKAGDRYAFTREEVPPYVGDQHATALQWQSWQLQMLDTALVVFRDLNKLGVAAATAAGPSAAAAVAAAVPADLCTHTRSSDVTASGCTAGDGRSTEAPSQGSSSSTAAGQRSSNHQQLKWGCLLRLQHASPRWAAALAAFDAKWRGWRDHAEGLRIEEASSEALQQVEQQYTDALQLSRALAAAAPLPILCNNPGCENLAGVSEAAAACKLCAGCRCRYCSAACHVADRKRHRHACWHAC